MTSAAIAFQAPSTFALSENRNLRFLTLLVSLIRGAMMELQS